MALVVELDNITRWLLRNIYFEPDSVVTTLPGNLA
jgi:hypothetical protein